MSDAPSNQSAHGRSSVHALVKMANQIAVNMAGSGDQHAAAVAAHISKFWPPSMRRQICRYLATDGNGLNPAAERALKLLDEC